MREMRVDAAPGADWNNLDAWCDGGLYIRMGIYVSHHNSPLPPEDWKEGRKKREILVGGVGGGVPLNE